MLLGRIFLPFCACFNKVHQSGFVNCNHVVSDQLQNMFVFTFSVGYSCFYNVAVILDRIFWMKEKLQVNAAFNSVFFLSCFLLKYIPFFFSRYSN